MQHTIWQYKRGDWEQIPWHISPAHEEEVIKKLGWVHHHRVGDIDVWELEGALLLLLHVDPDYARPVMSVICPDLPSYLMFRKEFGSLFLTIPGLRAEPEETMYEEGAAEAVTEKGH